MVTSILALLFLSIMVSKYSQDNKKEFFRHGVQVTNLGQQCRHLNISATPDNKATPITIVQKQPEKSLLF
jgi:hypothetical protein